MRRTVTLSVTPMRVAAVAIPAGLLVLVGCGSMKLMEPFQDAPRSSKTDANAADVITMPDGFSNLATKCVDGTRFTVVYHGDAAYGALAVTPADPTCKK